MSEECGFKSYEEAMKPVTRDGRSLIHLYPELQTQEIVTRAYREGAICLFYIREDLYTPELALMAVKRNGWNLEDIPAYCQTKEVIEAALKKSPGAKKCIKVKEIFKNALDEALNTQEGQDD